MKHNWQRISDDLESGQFESIQQAAEFLGIPYSTVYDAFGRGDIPANVVAYSTIPGFAELRNPPLESEAITFKESGNEATLRFKSAEPLTAAEAVKVAGIDMKDWRITEQKVNMWQMGRKAKEVDLTWEDGKVNGFVKDEGGFNKTYLYQVEVKLTRKRRIAVKTELRPINFIMPKPERHDKSRGLADDEILMPDISVMFICDPHFGFRQNRHGLVPIHHRGFISSLYRIAKYMRPDEIIWNGDLLDMADWSTFDTAPDLLYQTQIAGMEAGFNLARFRRTTNKQILIEGNHDQRLERMITKHLKSAFQLKPIHELEGEPLLSIPRFLGLPQLATEWIPGYPSAKYQIRSARFTHGQTVRKGSGRTVSAEINEATGDRFWGHIHRFELAQRYIEDDDRTIWVGSPGCACDKAMTPGSDETHNWQLGAFIIHFSGYGVAGIEHISGEDSGTAWFRGRAWFPQDYVPELKSQIPPEYAKWLD